MKKRKTIELKIYEFLGIKKFRKIALEACYLLNFPLFRLSKKEWNDFIHRFPSNYFLGKSKGLKDFKKMKKKLIGNGSFHMCCLFCNLSSLIRGTTSLPIPISVLIAFLNGYCIMLQRYNCIRISNLIERMTNHYEKAEEKAKEKQGNRLHEVLSRRIINKKECEIGEADENINKLSASIKELKQHREWLLYLEKAEKKSTESLEFLENGSIIK